MEVSYGKKALTGSGLKLIAMLTMLIDHIGASLIERYLAVRYIENDKLMMVDRLYILDLLFRLIGRLAFPIYIFLLVEGFVHTSNKWKYLGRLCLFAIISELPFDIAFFISGKDVKQGTIFYWDYQNVFFTLAIGLLTIIVIDFIYRMDMHTFFSVILQFIACVSGMSLAYLLCTDYNREGVLAIVVAYFGRTRLACRQNKADSGDDELERKRRLYAITGSCAVLTVFNLVEISSFIDVSIVDRYSGERGRGAKLLFYAFYPAHLMILGLICVGAGL